VPLLPRWITTFVGSLPRRLQYRTRAGAVENWRETTASTIPNPRAWSSRLAPSITESPMPRRPALIDPRAAGGVSAAAVRSATMAARSSAARGTWRGYVTTEREDRMAKVIVGMTISVDGFAADRHGSAGPLYPDLADLRDTDYMQAMIHETGAVLMGRQIGRASCRERVREAQRRGAVQTARVGSA